MAGHMFPSCLSLKKDVRNAGGGWVDEVVRAEDKVITIRKPEDMPKFCETIVKAFARRVYDAGMNSANEQCLSG